MQTDHTRRPAALLPIEEGLQAVADSYASGGVASREHMELSKAILKGRRAVLRTYGEDLRLMAEHLDEPDDVPGLAELVVHAAIPRLIPEMNNACRNPDVLAIRAQVLRSFLRGIIDIEPGEPYTLSYCDAATGKPERTVFGQIQDGPLELYATQGQSQDGLFLRTPLVRQDRSKFFRNGLIPVAAMAARTEEHVVYLELAAGSRVISSALRGRVAEMCQAETEDEAFAAATDFLKNAAANNVALETIASESELNTIQDLIAAQFVDAHFGTVDFNSAILAITRLDKSQQECLAKTRQNILRNLAQYDPRDHIQKLHDHCVGTARKLLLVDLLPQAKDEQTCEAMVQHVRQTFEGSDLLAYIKEAYMQVGTARPAGS